MARIIVSTEDGEVMNEWNDTREEIGDPSRSMSAQSLMDDIVHNLKVARSQEGRDPVTGDKE